jgi:hypothetical protein
LWWGRRWLKFEHADASTCFTNADTNADTDADTSADTHSC